MDHTVQCGGTRLVYTVHQTLPSLAEVGLACKTRVGHANRLLGVIIPIDLTKVLCIDLTTGLGVVSHGRLA